MNYPDKFSAPIDWKLRMNSFGRISKLNKFEKKLYDKVPKKIDGVSDLLLRKVQIIIYAFGWMCIANFTKPQIPTISKIDEETLKLEYNEFCMELTNEFNDWASLSEIAAKLF